jgi:hypothetical protein
LTPLETLWFRNVVLILNITVFIKFIFALEDIITIIA